MEPTNLLRTSALVILSIERGCPLCVHLMAFHGPPLHTGNY